MDVDMYAHFPKYKSNIPNSRGSEDNHSNHTNKMKSKCTPLKGLLLQYKKGSNQRGYFWPSHMLKNG